MNFKNVYRFSVLAFSHSSNNVHINRKCQQFYSSSTSSSINNLTHNKNSSGQNVSYVQRMKMLQKLREKSGIDEESLKRGKCLVYNKGDPLLTEDFSISWMNASDLNVDSKLFLENAILLGVSNDNQLQFSVQIASFGEEVKSAVMKKSNASFSDFRLSLMMMSAEEAALASKAKAVYNWHRKNSYCSNCGSKSVRNSTGSSRTCRKCREISYPTLSPVGIVLVSDKTNTRLLLVRQGRHPKGMYSCIAGYVDSGETLEESICREVAEEVGLTVLNVEYKASQHWSFPTSNLMIGCHAVVSGDEELNIDTMELEDARWFPVVQIKEALASIQANPLETMSAVKEGTGDFFIPPRGTLAHILIDSWMSRFA